MITIISDLNNHIVYILYKASSKDLQTHWMRIWIALSLVKLNNTSESKNYLFLLSYFTKFWAISYKFSFSPTSGCGKTRPKSPQVVNAERFASSPPIRFVDALLYRKNDQGIFICFHLFPIISNFHYISFSLSLSLSFLFFMMCFMPAHGKQTNSTNFRAPFISKQRLLWLLN